MTIGFTGLAHAETITFQYDQLNRLKKVTDDSSYFITYSYDAAGNRLTKKSSTKPIFSDEIVPGQTLINSQYISELQSAINIIRGERGLPNIAWDGPYFMMHDPILVRYIRELRAAVEDLHGGDIQWTDDVLYSYSEDPQRATPIRAQHIIELRDQIDALWDSQ